MQVSSDFVDLFRVLNDSRVRYLVVGAHAFGYHAEPRFTKDLDVWVEPSAENARQVWKAVLLFGAPLKGITVEDFTSSDLIYQIGVPPHRIDIMTGIEGATFSEAWRNRVRTLYGEIPILILSKSDLIRTKRAAGRPQDLMDVQSLLNAGKKRRLPRKRK